MRIPPKRSRWIISRCSMPILRYMANILGPDVCAEISLGQNIYSLARITGLRVGELFIKQNLDAVDKMTISAKRGEEKDLRRQY